MDKRTRGGGFYRVLSAEVTVYCGVRCPHELACPETGVVSPAPTKQGDRGNRNNEWKWKKE